MIRILVADHHPLYRDGLLAAIERRGGLSVVGTPASGDEVLAAARRHRPDVLVLDPELSGLGGLTVIRALAEERLPTKVLILSDAPGRTMVYDAVSAGARGYLLKSEDAETICAGIERIAGGHTVWDEQVQEALASEIRGRGSSDGSRPLSPRELEVLKLIADGHSTAEVAARLYLSVATVKTHLHRAFTKLEVNDRAAAVAEAMRRGLFE